MNVAFHSGVASEGARGGASGDGENKEKL